MQHSLLAQVASTNWQVGTWLEYATYIVGGGALEPACRTLNEALSMRTFLAGYSLSVADMAIWGQLQGGCRLFCAIRLPVHWALIPVSAFC